MSRPYRESVIKNGTMIREFNHDGPSEELEWHMDRRTRHVTVVEGDGWKLQLESGLPFVMVPGRTYEIPMRSWHRVIKGEGNLRIIVDEN
jgi:quercetin dioxygenase-like cupin family protein